ncbi:MAG TPA: DotU family type IV/VI secretion system protein [Terracidiphilus sp.]|nr:DotU family type IV/VI secretion system protein [Terracidiphilus sp.]
MPDTPSRTQNLASCYETSLTVILRLASQHQSSTNSQSFRTNIRAALRAAMEQAKALGYSSEMNQLAFFAVVALLDESVLKLQNPVFADWAQRPLQEEMFGHARAGEVFFDQLLTLLSRQDSLENADCLEVYCLCMLLGFKGKYALRSSLAYGTNPSSTGSWEASRPSGEISTLIRQCRDKIDRIRGGLVFLPLPVPQPIKQSVKFDRWSRALGIVALVLLFVLLLTFAGTWMALRSGAAQIG